MSQSAADRTPSPLRFPLTESTARRTLEVCLGDLDRVLLLLATLAAAKPGPVTQQGPSDELQHLTESAAAALDGLRPEVEHLRRDLASWPTPVALNLYIDGLRDRMAG